MTFPESEVNIIATKILVDTQGAIATLQSLVGTIENSADRIKVLKEIIKKTASAMGGSIKEATKEVREFSSTLTGISSKEVNLAGRMALEEVSGKLQSVIDKEKQLGIEQGKVGTAGSQASRKLLAEEQKLIAAREKENILIEQAGQKLSTQLIAQQKLADNKASAAIQKEQAAVEQQGQKLSNKLLAQENLERQKAITAQEKENILIKQEGESLSNQLLARQRIADQAAKQKASTPQQVIPNFVQKQFGDINAYIAQSQNKIEAWKRVVTSSAKAAGVSFEQAGTELRKMVSGTTVAPLNTALKQLGNDGRNSFQKLIDGAHFARIALGALASMLLFQVIQAFTQTFTQASDQARQLEENIWRLTNAERALSEAGTDISLKGMEDAITRIQKKFKVFSREDITQLYSSIAVATKQLGLSEKEIADVTESVVFLNIQSSKQEDLMTTQASLLSSLLGKSSTGISQLGVSFKTTFIEQEAFRMGLLKTGETLEDLTDDEIAHVKTSLLVQAGYADTAEGLEIINEFLETNSAKLQTNKSAWEDLLATMGQGLNNLLPALDGVFEGWQKDIEVGNIKQLFIQQVKKEKGIWANFNAENNAIVYKLALGIALTQKEYDKLKKTIEGMDDKDILKLFPDPSAIKDRFTRELIQSLVEVKDTATELPDPLVSDAVDEESLKALDDLDDKLREIALDAKQAQEDLDLKFSQKRGDLNVEYDRKGADAARDHAQKLEDINRDALDKVADAKRKAREDEKKAEQDLLQKLKELRQQFLMDLDDALHARDARQILRLIKEYNFEKQNILDRKKLDDKQRKEKLADDLKAIEEDRKRRIQQEQIEYKRKLEDLRIAKQREIDELNLWYAREQEDIAKNVEQKLEKLLDGYIQEGILHEEQLSEIEGILAKHFGTQMGMVDNLVAYMQTRFAQMASMSVPVGAPSGNVPLTGSFIGGGGQSVLTPSGSQNINKNTQTPTRPSTKPVRVPAFADGGTLFANKPTLALFGEKQPEFARFVPANQMSRGGLGGGEMGVNGEIGLELLLSPDLEARVVRNAMNGTARIVTKIRRTK